LSQQQFRAVTYVLVLIKSLTAGPTAVHAGGGDRVDDIVVELLVGAGVGG